MDEKGQKQILGSGRLRVGSGSSHETYLTTAYGQGQTFLDRSDKGSLSDCFRDMADKSWWSENTRYRSIADIFSPSESVSIRPVAYVQFENKAPDTTPGTMMIYLSDITRYRRRGQINIYETGIPTDLTRKKTGM